MCYIEQSGSYNDPGQKEDMAAKSLICKDCNILLKSIAEAQSHNEVTGHSNFEETTIAVRILGVIDAL